jgi:hypothetical protein
VHVSWLLCEDLAGGLSALSASVLKGVASLRPVPVSLQLSPVTLTDRVVALLSPKRDEQRRQRIRALAALRIQKVYRGFLGREAAASARQAKAIKGSMVLPTVLLRPSNRERKRRHRAAWIINANVSKVQSTHHHAKLTADLTLPRPCLARHYPGVLATARSHDVWVHGSGCVAGKSSMQLHERSSGLGVAACVGGPIKCCGMRPVGGRCWCRPWQGASSHASTCSRSASA